MWRKKSNTKRKKEKQKSRERIANLEWPQRKKERKKEYKQNKQK